MTFDTGNHNTSGEYPPIPKEFWEEIRRWAETKKKGNIILHVKDGKVLGFSVEDKTHSTIA